MIGLVLGLALGAAASQPQRPRNAYDSQGYDRNYYGAAAPAYPQRPACTRRERQWDRYANRTVTVDVPC